MEKHVRVGIGVIMRKDEKVLLGKRKGEHAADIYAFPGGHLEFGESPEECARREVMEEVGCEIENIQQGPWEADYFDESQKHYITLMMVCDYKEGEILVKEPEKCEGWDWYVWDAFPENLFNSTKIIREKGYDPFR